MTSLTTATPSRPPVWRPEDTVLDFACTDYTTIWTQQLERVQALIDDQQPNTLMLGEHPPVITLGRGSHHENLLNPSIPVIPIERGGDVTYHGPGQLIAYPILRLPPGRQDLHQYLRDLETVLIDTLAAFNLEGVRNPGWTGVWIHHPAQGRLMKVASIGVAVKRWVTYHGLALNVCTQLDHFRQINPCGLESQIMTSMADCLQRPLAVAKVKPVLVSAFARVFG